MKLTGAQEWLLKEALRRFVTFHPGEELERAWTGLGSATQYKPVLKAGLMTYACGPHPGYTTWFKLTKEGAAIVQEWLDIPITYEDIYDTGAWHTKILDFQYPRLEVPA